MRIHNYIDGAQDVGSVGMKRSRMVALAAAVAVASTACGVFSGQPARSGPSQTPQSSSPQATSPEPTSPFAGKRISPFTGKRGVPKKPVLVAAIDNSAAARPQTGLALADIVYVEPVEAGLSRFLAVYSARLPEAAGPIRSARVSNIPLLRQYGKPAFGYSGAHPKLVPRLRKAHLVNVPSTRVPGPYYRVDRREAPHNLYVDPARLLERANKLGDVSKAHDIGFRFGPPPRGGKKVERRTVGYESARIGFRWSGEKDRWLVSMGGSPLRTVTGTRVSARTVVVQYVDIHPSNFKGPAGYVTPDYETVGSGAAVVLRGGEAYQARWSRPKPTSGTKFTTPSGKRLNFARGPVWVVFEDAADR